MYESGSDPVFQKVVRLLEQFVSLTGQTGYDVYSEEHRRLQAAVRICLARLWIHFASYVIYLLREKFCGIFSSHILQNRIASTLERNMEMRLELGP